MPLWIGVVITLMTGKQPPRAWLLWLFNHEVIMRNESLGQHQIKYPGVGPVIPVFNRAIKRACSARSSQEPQSKGQRIETGRGGRCYRCF